MGTEQNSNRWIKIDKVDKYGTMAKLLGFRMYIYFFSFSEMTVSPLEGDHNMLFKRIKMNWVGRIIKTELTSQVRTAYRKAGYDHQSAKEQQWGTDEGSMKKKWKIPSNREKKSCYFLLPILIYIL